MNSRGQERTIAQEFRTHVWILGGLVALMWAVEFLDVFVRSRKSKKKKIKKKGNKTC